MRCWNCGRKLPEMAKVCGFCEATVGGEPTEQEEAVVRDLLKQMPPEAFAALRAAFESSDTAEDFANRIMEGDCPKCGSQETGDFGTDPEIGEEGILVGRCYRCGQLWCTECGRLLERDAPFCECWAEDE